MINSSFPNRSRGSYLLLLRSFSILLIASMLISPIGALCHTCGRDARRGAARRARMPPDHFRTAATRRSACSFPHIPCTPSPAPSPTSRRGATGGWRSGSSASRRSVMDLYLVTINALDTPQQRKDFQTWQNIRKIA